MALTGLPFLVVLVGAAAAVVALTMLLWNRWPRWWAFPMRLLCLLLVMLVGTGLAGDMVNRSYDFYTSFSDLLGHASGPGPAVPEPVQDWGVQNGTRRVLRVRLDGARSHLSRDALVYLPAAYFQPSQAGHRFPVIELFHGYPGNPVNWFRELHVAEMLDGDPQALRAMRGMRRAAGHRLPVVSVTLPSGGHNFHVWYAASLAAFPWLGAHLLPAATASPTT